MCACVDGSTTCFCQWVLFHCQSQGEPKVVLACLVFTQYCLITSKLGTLKPGNMCIILYTKYSLALSVSVEVLGLLPLLIQLVLIRC